MESINSVRTAGPWIKSVLRRRVLLVAVAAMSSGCDSSHSGAWPGQVMTLLDAADARTQLVPLGARLFNAKHAKAFLGAESPEWKRLEADVCSDAVHFPEELRRLVDLGSPAVKALAQLLEDDRYRIRAAVVLGLIGSEEASAAISRNFLRLQWLEETTSYRSPSVGAENQARGSSSLVSSATAGDAGFLEVLKVSLIRAGTSDPRPLIDQTMSALETVLLRAKRGQPLLYETEEVKGDEILTHYVRCAELSAVRRGLEVLAWVGGDAAAPLFRRALGSGVREVYLDALTFARWYGASEILDALEPHLADNTTLAEPVTVGHLAASAIVAIHGRTWGVPMGSLSKERADIVLERAKRLCAGGK